MEVNEAYVRLSGSPISNRLLEQGCSVLGTDGRMFASATWHAVFVLNFSEVGMHHFYIKS